MERKIALAGNPNSGKTTLFNALTGANQYVGNWPGVTVEKKEGKLKGHKDVTIQDLPGIYSLSPYSPEEVVARAYLTEEKPNAILNIVDGTNIERNLYLTTQLMELGIPVVVAVNMMDLAAKNGDAIDLEKLSKGLGCPVVGLSALKGKGVDEAVSAVLRVAQSGETANYRAFAVDEATLAEGDDVESATAAARYDFIGAVVDKAVKKGRAAHSLSVSDKIDRVVTSRILALPIFVGVMFLIYSLAVGKSIGEGGFAIGTFATDWCNDVLFGEWIPGAVTGWLEGMGCSPWLMGLIVDGVIGGVGAVLGFVPQMLVLFLLLSILEDIGYMARVAFIMDRIFRKFGLSGKSFIPMLIGMGCGVPGIMASRTIEHQRDRRMTVMTTCFIPCSAKMPIVALFAGALFGGSALVAVSAYFIGVAAIALSGIILKKTRAFAGEPAPFVMELPAYHVPAVGNVLRATWERGWSFIKRAGTVILASSVILWFLQGFGFENGVFAMVEDNNASLLAAMGGAVCWVFAPLGFGDWQSTVATVTGLIAKENVVSTFGVLFHLGEELGADDPGLLAVVGAHYSAISAYSFMIFNLLCAPCFAAMGAIRREMNSGKWTAAAIGYMCGFAYVAALMVYQFGSAFTGRTHPVGIVVAAACLVGMLWLLCRGREKAACDGVCAGCKGCH